MKVQPCVLRLALALALLPLLCAPAQAAVRLSNADQMFQIRAEADLGAPRPLEPVRIVGPRNGYCSGQVVASGDSLAAIRATMGDLKSADGSTISAANCTVRYAGLKTLQRAVATKNAASDPLGIGEVFSNFPYYDVLNAQPPASPALLPVWLTVHVPADARPGRYTGTLTVGDAPVPVQLDVGAWRCPDPRDWVMHTAFVESPESVAMQYNVPIWSERHLALLEASLKLLGELWAIGTCSSPPCR